MKVNPHKKLDQDSGFTGYVALKGFFKITADWGLNNQQQRILLGNIPEQTFYKYKRLPDVKLNKDILERISYILGIRKALMTLFPNKQRADAWITKPNRDFGNASALDAMLGGSITDLARVRHYLDAWRG
ncbi:MbcA/ParS/Xre antitoxin family protein [Nitrosococcus oceani]|uniref:Uncharacterized protein n=2 Tax=Nitrosococcus oceani TaxID=1229 RepID=Q3J742_NITOC|nr:MbcA/ParS/Xre antitoxin family protein [Nitrosococcus oceani]KFI18239.1 hypothetical protein IB75_15420 [Nitrosococcus oceani C-27]ABA59354.1 conserved hypothetical protein [Nitrosococcus oceani ATCC 19707]EDZ65878.1 hypothetical protein NOC27_2558 [Nitrosococcus oceani AFC27]KFI21556.1 hypothetical protein HW44_15055 [Nitrosococcus oceani]GEM20078.1 hypothetical protein NONS58_14840 [Nitrosococcus oceani]